MHHVGILYDQFMMHGQRNIKLLLLLFAVFLLFPLTPPPPPPSFCTVHSDDVGVHCGNTGIPHLFMFGGRHSKSNAVIHKMMQ